MSNLNLIVFSRFSSTQCTVPFSTLSTCSLGRSDALFTRRFVALDLPLPAPPIPAAVIEDVADDWPPVALLDTLEILPILAPVTDDACVPIPEDIDVPCCCCCGGGGWPRWITLVMFSWWPSDCCTLVLIGTFTGSTT